MRSFVRGLVRGAPWALAWGAFVACTESHAVTGTLFDAAIGTGGGADGDAALVGNDAATADPGSNTTGTPALGCVDCQGADLLGLVQFPSCCTTDSKCGLDFAAVAGMPLCLERDAPGNADPTCPAAMASMFSLPGCCRPDGTCGALSTLVPLGCISSDIASLLPGAGGGGGNGATQTCTPAP